MLPHEDTRSQLGKFNFTKPLMFHKVLESKSGAATENRVTRPLCRTWRRHPVGSSGPRFTPPQRLPAGRRGQKCSEDRPHPSPHLSSGAEHGAARRRGRTRGTHRDIRDAQLPARPAARSFITAAADAAPPLPLPPPPLLRPPEISISQPSNTSPASRPHRPNSQLQTNRAYLI